MDLSGATPQKPIVARAKAIILTPRDEWPVIAAETTTQGDILKSYVLPLAAIGPVAGFIGGQLFGYGAFGISFRPGLIAGLSSAIISYALGIVGIFILAFIVNALAPKFGGTENKLNAFKLVAYGATASWLAGVFGLIPSLGFFGLLGLYSIYLFYTGATPLMQVPQDKAVGYVAVTILCAIVLAIIIAPITAAVTGLWGMSTIAASSNEEISGEATIPGVGTVDLGKMQQAAKQMEDAASGKSPPVEAAKLSELLPTAIAGYQRTAIESTGMGNVGSTAQGTYTAGDKSFTLKIADMAAIGGLAAFGSAMGVEQSREDANGYQRTQTVNGQMQTEEWNNAGSSGKFGRMVGNRFLVEAEGNVGSMADLKSAVATVDPDDLTDLVD